MAWATLEQAKLWTRLLQMGPKRGRLLRRKADMGGARMKGMGRRGILPVVNIGRQRHELLFCVAGGAE